MCTEPPQTIIFFLQLRYTAGMFRDLPITARELKATPEVLERVYEAARLGLRGESLALAAGMLPQEYARLKLMDRVAEIAEMKGRADSEMAMSRVVFDAAEAGDSKAALEFLKHRHDWVAKQQVQVDVSQQISITAALEQAQRRVEMIEEVVDISAQPKVVIEPKALARELGEEV
jgi:predicted transcriptional regulator